MQCVITKVQAKGDAAIVIVADLQDPPEIIEDFIHKWEEGFKIVVGVKTRSEESRIFFVVRKLYYALIARLSDVDLVKNFTGFGLYDREVLDVLRGIDDPYPYFRGLICDLGFQRAEVEPAVDFRKLEEVFVILERRELPEDDAFSSDDERLWTEEPQ